MSILKHVPPIPFWDRKRPLSLVSIKNETANPFIKKKIKVSLLLCSDLPYENSKFLTVLGLLGGARMRGNLKDVEVIVDATSGNSGLMYASLAGFFGKFVVELVVNKDLPAGKRDPLDLSRARIIHPDPASGLSTVGTARERGKLSGYFNPDQYANPDNSALFREWLGHMLLQQAPDITGLVAGMGTGGTIIGLSQCMQNAKKHRMPVIIGALCAPDHEVPGLRDIARMQRDVEQPWGDFVDKWYEIETRPSYIMALWLQWLLSVPSGPSGGLAYLAGLKRLYDLDREGQLDTIRDPVSKWGHVVVVIPDTARPYGDRFKAVVPERYWGHTLPPTPIQLVEAMK